MFVIEIQRNFPDFYGVAAAANCIIIGSKSFDSYLYMASMSCWDDRIFSPALRRRNRNGPHRVEALSDMLGCLKASPAELEEKQQLGGDLYAKAEVCVRSVTVLEASYHCEEECACMCMCVTVGMHVDVLASVPVRAGPNSNQCYRRDQGLHSNSVADQISILSSLKPTTSSSQRHFSVSAKIITSDQWKALLTWYLM